MKSVSPSSNPSHEPKSKPKPKHVPCCLFVVFVLAWLPASGRENEFSRMGLPSTQEVEKPSGKSSKVLESANREVLKNPDSTKGYMMRGEYYLAALEDELAIKEFDRVIKLAPKCGQAYLQRAIAYEHLEKYGEAFKDYSTAAKVGTHETAWIAFKNSAVLHSNLGEYSAAIENFSQALKYANDPVSYFRRAECYLLAKQYDSAIKDASQFLKLTDGDHRAYWVRAQAFEGAKNPRAALKDISELIRLTEIGNPDSCFEFLTRYYQFRARIYEQLGKKELSHKDLQKAELASRHALKVAPFRYSPKP